METGADGRCAEPRKPSYCPGGKVHRGPLLARPAGSPGSPATCTIRRRTAPCRLVRQEAQVPQLHVRSAGARPPAGSSGRKPRFSSYMYHPPARGPLPACPAGSPGSPATCTIHRRTAPCRLVRQEAQALQLHVPSTGARPPAGSSGRKPRFSPATCTIRRARPPAGLSGRKPRFPSYMYDPPARPPAGLSGGKPRFPSYVYDPPAHGPLPARPAGSPGSPATCTIRRARPPAGLSGRKPRFSSYTYDPPRAAPSGLSGRKPRFSSYVHHPPRAAPCRLVRQEAQVERLRHLRARQRACTLRDRNEGLASCRLNRSTHPSACLALPTSFVSVGRVGLLA